MSIRAVLAAFVTIFPAELPDKTMIATIVLVARYRRPAWVWAGATAAFTVHVVAAVAAGRAVALLPDAVVRSVVSALFAVGAILLFRAGLRARSESADVEDGVEGDGRLNDSGSAGAWSALAGSFGVIVLAEWGDLTQIATASLAARSGQPVSTAIGALAALAAVAALAVTAGRHLLARVPLHLINFVGAAVFAALAVFTLAELVGLVV